MNVPHDPWSALQIAMDEHSEGTKYACPNPDCRTIYGITRKELEADADQECGRCGWGPMAECTCAGCGRKVSNANFALVTETEDMEYRVWCDGCRGVPE